MYQNNIIKYLAYDGLQVTHLVITTGTKGANPVESPKYIDYLANILLFNLAKHYGI